MSMMKRFRPVAAVAALAGLLVLSACGSSDDGDSDSAPPDGSAAYPVTIEHALGTTTIDSEPTRVVTWGFGSTDAALALGVVPVAIPQQTYGGDDDGVLPWIKEKLADMDAETPTMLTNQQGSDEIPLEEIAAANPDVILANYSGLTQADYDTLSDLAPTVAYPDQPWATPWRDVVRTVGTALGKKPEAEKLITDTERVVADKAAEHPELKGKTVAAVWDTGDAFYVYKPADPRVEFLTDLGLKSAPSVDELSTDESTFYYTMSYEELDKLTSDILLSYADSDDAAQTFLDAPYAQGMEQVKSGHVASMTGPEPVAAVSPPTVLSLTWGIDDYLTELSKAAAGN
ncbi:iron-siderophore ABC transporter substrate-binding protein [Solicola gregarius]|uniref:Iron-siderophore ABC transporter substrate-binding protein n=1 Tax=Solicola gregarius TaxID=2908642 RepID=A0AA46TFN1_9ACTN|nr:iron-siderophore ABC transporter substrate-binding protein [Solicola gregarius]UYM03994.1 iron-siderophore ABC transporter substrate-binding protein [Solicola gregarius]